MGSGRYVTMKYNKTILFFLFIFCITIQGSERKCWIKNIVGEVKIQRKKSPKWIKARPNMVLKEKDAIRTFVESEVVLEISDGSQIKLEENTTLELSSYTISGKGAEETALKVMSGNLMANVKKLVNSKSKFEFETPTAVAAIRGTSVGFEVEKTKTNIVVYEGKVYVAPKGSKKGAELKSNQKTTIVKGQETVVVEDMTDSKRSSSESSDTTGNETDTTLTDTTENETDTTSTDTTATTDQKLELKVVSPENGQVVLPKSQIVIKGTVTPGDAEVLINGMKVKLSNAGGFRKVITAKDDEGEYTVTVEAIYNNESKTISRHYFVKDMPVDLNLNIFEPKDGQIINEPIVHVAGVVMPPLAEITISGLNVSVSPDGSFKKEIPIADEEGDVTVEIEAVYKDKSVVESRTVTYKFLEEDIALIIQAPPDNRILCDRQIQVKGTIRPVSIEEVIVQGLTIRVRNGVFDDFIMLPEEPGEHEIEFEAVGRDKNIVERRTVRFDPAGNQCNIDPPTIQPTTLPLITKSSRLPFTVFDKTLFDEIQVHTSIDGMKDVETGMPGSTFYLEIEPGVHMYEVYAEDLNENKSQKVIGKISRLVEDLVIRMENPSGNYHLLHIPPFPQGKAFAPEFSVEFSIENLPDDNTKLLKEIRVINHANGNAATIKNFYDDIEFEVDIKLKRGQNQISIEVRDINDKIIQKQFVIEIR